MKRSNSTQEFWLEFCRLNLEVDPTEQFQVWYFGDGPELADQLCDLVLSGTKTATAALVWEAEADPVTAPVIGGCSVVTNFAGAPRCVIRTTDIQIIPFDEVPADFAFDEGEGDRSLEYWRKAHWDYFTKRCRELGNVSDTRMPIICERFELLS
ncbi:MAG: ASCH domain-containing protein [Pyrinomonadaceae bacterium]